MCQGGLSEGRPIFWGYALERLPLGYILGLSRIDSCTDTRYGILVIRTFRHKGLKRLFQTGEGNKLRAEQLHRIEDVLAHLDQAEKPCDLDLPGYPLHALKGERKGVWSVTISANWRVVFRFSDGDAFDVDLIDYH